MAKSKQESNTISVKVRTRGRWRMSLARVLLRVTGRLLAGVRMDTRFGSEHWREMPERLHIDAHADWRKPRG